MTDPIRHEWSPGWAPNVKGWFEERRFDDETRQPEETPWGAECTTCGAKVKGMCTSGLFKQHIGNFALAHTHRDPLTGERR